MTEKTLSHDDAGTGVPLLLIHGFPLDRRSWHPQIDGLQDAARVIAPDLRGFGASGDAHHMLTMDDHAADLKALLDHLGVQRAVIGGLSMGGYIALAFLARYPGAVQGLILCNTRAGADSEETRAGRVAMADKVLQTGASPLAEEMLPKMLSQEIRSARPALAASILAMMAEQRSTGVAASLRGIAERPDRTNMLAAITVPTLVITGDADTLIAPAESEAMAEAIPGSTLVAIPGVAHLSNVEAPEAFNAAVRDLLSGLG